MTCSLCKGAGTLVCFPGGQPEYWPCPACGNAGTRILYAPPAIGPGARRRASPSFPEVPVKIDA